jgi:hypothetical protein
MKTSLWPVTLVALLIATARADDKPLANLIERLKNHTANGISPISLTASGLLVGRDLSLKFSLTNISGKTLSIYPESLPWGNIYAITWVALTDDGRVLPLRYAIVDPPPETPVSVTPGQTLTGTYNLSSMLDGSAVPSGKDIVIVWVYRFPAGPSEGPDSRPLNTGTTVVHTPK